MSNKALSPPLNEAHQLRSQAGSGRLWRKSWKWPVADPDRAASEPVLGGICPRTGEAHMVAQSLNVDIDSVGLHIEYDRGSLR